jgi:CDP-6-deoxy-D-xylo-4-hexulose-3-dehydrase
MHHTATLGTHESLGNSHDYLNVPIGDFRVSERERWYLDGALASGQVSYGPLSEEFEARIANIHDTRYGLFMNSGTSALHIALAALKQLDGWKDGDEVIVPATTFVATANVVLHNNLTPVFVDVDNESFNIRPDLIENYITPRTRCIMPVHLLGLPANMEQIVKIARRHGLRIIEDSCESMFAEQNGQMVGSMGDIGCFSTYVAHYIVTGVGGVAVTSDPAVGATMRSLMNHGRNGIYISHRDGLLASGSRAEEIISKRFQFESLGHSFRSTDLQAALGLGQLDVYQEIYASRLANAHEYVKGLKALNDRIVTQTASYEASNAFMVFGFRVKDQHKRGLVRFLETRGIETRDLLPLVNQPVYHKLGYRFSRDEYPNAWELINDGMYIGAHQFLSADQISWVVDSIYRYFEVKG